MSQKLKLLILSGLCGAGKSTLARRLSTENPTAIVVERDDVRRHFPGLDEPQLTLHLVDLAGSFLAARTSVIIDACNLHSVDAARWASLAARYRAALRWVHVGPSINECVRRDAARPNPVGAARIREMAVVYRDRLSVLEATP